ncbi:MAG: TetR/AcrR family transcriptional regulator [Syntrophobacteraceae bacterium]
MGQRLSPQQRRGALGVRSEKRVREILSVARDVFAEKGFAKATTAEIALRLGTSEATVFTYFGSKRELCMEVLKVWYDEIIFELEREAPLIEGLRARLHFIVHKHLKHMIEEGTGICALVLSEGRNGDQEFMNLVTDIKRRYTGPVMAILSAAQESGEIRQDIPLRLMRDMVYGSLEHLLWTHIVTGQAPDVDLTASQLSEMLWRAFTPPDQSVEALVQLRADVADALRRAEKRQG